MGFLFELGQKASCLSLAAIGIAFFEQAGLGNKLFIPWFPVAVKTKILFSAAFAIEESNDEKLQKELEHDVGFIEQSVDKLSTIELILYSFE